MNVKEVINNLRRQYPNKNIICNPPINPTEILCETDPVIDHPDYSVAIAVVDRTFPHKHARTTETYEVIIGKLTLIINRKIITLNSGEKMTIHPNQIHEAHGKETWVKVTSNPGWEIKDHLLV